MPKKFYKYFIQIVTSPSYIIKTNKLECILKIVTKLGHSNKSASTLDIYSQTDKNGKTSIKKIDINHSNTSD